MKILATYSIKGGVGKTATAVNLAHLAAAGGARVLVWDLDPQGAATFYFRVKPKVKGGARGLVTGRRDLDDAVKATDFDRLDLVPADFSYRNLDLELDTTKKPTRRITQLLKPVRREYDWVFLDCPPSVSLVSENVIEAADALLVPVIPTTLSLRTLDQLEAFLADNDWRRRLPSVLAFFSMVEGRRKLHRELLESARAEHPGVLETEIPAASDVERMGVHRAPLAAYTTRGRAITAYRALWDEIERCLTSPRRRSG
ncbi:MAG: AAA family ATPase [Acidimicrobiales bacterium]